MFERGFIDGCLSGRVDPEELNDYVEYWHSHETGDSLQDFLGMSQSEHEAWLILGNGVIREIIRCRAANIPFDIYTYLSGKPDDKKKGEIV